MKKSLVVLALAATACEASAFAINGNSPAKVLLKKGVAALSKKSASLPVEQKAQAFSGLSDVQSSTQIALSADGGAAEPESGGKEMLITGSFFALWYLFNIGYNIYNKQALNVLAYPWTIATIQMGVGIPYFLALWAFGIRKAPKLSMSDIKTLIPVALCHTGVHVGAVIALGALLLSAPCPEPRRRGWPPSLLRDLLQVRPSPAPWWHGRCCPTSFAPSMDVPS